MAVDPNSLANLTPHQFKPGQSGNPGGVPRGTKHASPRRAMMRALGKGFEKDTEAEGDDDRIGVEALALAREILDAAMNGDADKVRAIATIIDQVEGKPQERVEHSGAREHVVILHGNKGAPKLPPGVS